MNRNIAIVTVVAIACAVGALATAAPPQQQPQPQLGSVVVQHFPGPGLYTYKKNVPPPEGCVTASADPVTRRVWAARLGCAQQGEDAGLELVGLKPPKPINGATIVATFDVKQLAGAWSLVLNLHRSTGTVDVGQTPITHTGTQIVVSSPLALEAGQAYGAMAFALADQHCGDACAIAFTIKEIKWQLP